MKSKGTPQKHDLLLRDYMVDRVLLRPSSSTIQHFYTNQIKKTGQPMGHDAKSRNSVFLILFVHGCCSLSRVSQLIAADFRNHP